jgi:release factor glutamine methyltransferase
MVDRRVLIPRPETEVVAGLALAELARRRDERGPGAELAAVDVGTGSGAIALSLAVEEPRVSVVAVELSSEALEVARANLVGIGRSATRVLLVAGDRFAGVPPDLAGELDVVVANPPYLAEDEPLDAEVADWEPRVALVAGPRGTELLDALVAEAADWLAPGGALVLELAPWQAAELADRARAAGYVDVAVHPDLAGRDRALVARRPSR